MSEHVSLMSLMGMADWARVMGEWAKPCKRSYGLCHVFAPFKINGYGRKDETDSGESRHERETVRVQL